MTEQANLETVGIGDIYAARETIRRFVHRTPLFGSETLSSMTGTRLTFKAENLQKTGSFKARGALNACLHLPDGERERGVITVSAGNHGAAVAYAAMKTGIDATVVMPEGAMAAKIAAVRAYGARAVLVDGTHLMESMEEIQAREGQTLIHPFENPHVVAGAGTVALELFEDAESLPEIIVVPIGGGGQISGVATVARELAPTARIIGVEPEGSNVVTQSLQAGHPLRLSSFATVADGLNAPWSGPLTLSIVQRLVEAVVTVPDSAIVQAMTLIVERMKLLVEPSGAAGLAALLCGSVPEAAGRRVTTILTGGNIDLRRLGQLLG